MKHVSLSVVAAVALSLSSTASADLIQVDLTGTVNFETFASGVLNEAVFISFLCLTGSLQALAYAVPVDAGMAIVLWIGIVITSQAFQATPKHHAPAVVVGLLPGVAAWGTLLAKSGLRAGGVGVPGGEPFGPDLIEKFRATDLWIHGAFAIEQGFIFTAMILSAMTVAVIERRFGKAALWCSIAAVLSATGVLHSYEWTFGDTRLSTQPAWPWAIGYAMMGACFFLARWLTEPVGDPAGKDIAEHR